jgi:hypothetical protein
VDDLKDLFDRLPVGWSVVEYDGRRWGVTRTVLVGGRSEKVLAEALDGSDLVLKPCEMPEAKVLAFLRGLRPEA